MRRKIKSSTAESLKYYTYKKCSLLDIVKTFKYILQCCIGAFIILFTIFKIIDIAFPQIFRQTTIFNLIHIKFLRNLFEAILLYYYDMRFLDIIAKALLASTAIELGYMLFTPGPDEAVVPIITGLAAFILSIMSESPSFKRIICIGILIITMGCLFKIKSKYIDEELIVTKYCISSGKGKCFKTFIKEISIESLINIDSAICNYTFDSTNKKVAEVDINGMITIKGVGLADIKIISNKDGERDTLVHRVKLTVKTAHP